MDHSSSWYIGSKLPSSTERITKMKTRFREALAKDKQARRDQIAAIKQSKVDGVIDSEDEQFELD